LSRIFTTLQEVDDNLILYSIVAAFVLNAVLAIQMVYYWNSPANKTAVPAKQNKKAVANSPAAAQASGVSPKPAGKSPTTRRRG
jgi:mannose-P-dolichol utilization defect protein 1